jgi:hypothetical protein
VRPLVIVILHPPAQALPRLLEGREARPADELLPDRLPKALYFPKRLRMVRPTANMLDPVPFQFLLELGLAVPTRILPAIIRQHLLGHPMRSHTTPKHLQQIVGRLAAEYFQGRDVPGMIVDKPDQVGITARPQPFGRPDSFPTKLEGKDIALPHLIGRGALEKARLRRVGRGLLLFGRDELFAAQGLPHRFRARRQVEYPP